MTLFDSNLNLSPFPRQDLGFQHSMDKDPLDLATSPRLKHMKYLTVREPANAKTKAKNILTGLANLVVLI
jgi:hypothetical protein